MEKFSDRINFEFEGRVVDVKINDSSKRISVSGVQEKFPGIVENGEIRLSREGERSTHILKPAPWDPTLSERRLVPVNEHLTMQIASRVYGIVTAENTLCFTPKGKPVYVTKRFDIDSSGQKYLMEDFASILGRMTNDGSVHYKYGGSYEDIAVAIRKYVPAWIVDLEMFFKIVTFNYIFCNGDAHLKNFSLVTINGERRLSPAYDLLNTSLHIQGDDFALDGGLSSSLTPSPVWASTGHPCRLDFENFASLVGLNPVRYNAVLDLFEEIPTSVENMVSASVLPDKYKRIYMRTVSERTARFNRKNV